MSLHVEGEVRSAKRDYQSLQMKQEVLNNTIGRIFNTPGLPPEQLDQAVALRHQAQVLSEQIGTEWNALNEPIKVARRRRDELKNQRSKARDVAEQGRIASEVSKAEGDMNSAEAVLEKPSAAIAALHDVADALIEAVRRLYLEVTSESTIEAEGRAAFEVNKAEFEAGRDHHRTEARILLATMGILLAGGLGALYLLLFHNNADWTTLAEAKWPRAALVIIGRFTVLAGMAWLLVFLGRLHSQHSQQAVTYQDRLAGLDAAALVLHYGANLKVREEMLGRFVEAYISGDANAFRPQKAEPHERRGESTVKELASELGPLAKAVEPIVKAVSGK